MIIAQATIVIIKIQDSELSTTSSGKFKMIITRANLKLRRFIAESMLIIYWELLQVVLRATV